MRAMIHRSSEEVNIENGTNDHRRNLGRAHIAPLSELYALRAGSRSGPRPGLMKPDLYSITVLPIQIDIVLAHKNCYFPNLKNRAIIHMMVKLIFWFIKYY